MSLEDSLQQLARNVTPSDEKRHAMKASLEARIRPTALLNTISATSPSPSLRLSLKETILRAIRPETASDLASLAESIDLAPTSFQTLRSVILSRLQPLKPVPMVHSGFKWAAAFAMFILIIRSMPLLLLAPATQAELGVQLVPGGDNVSVYVGGVWRDATETQIIHSAVMVRTGAAGATLVLNDDGVLRLAPDTTVKLHDIGDRPQFKAEGPTATLIRGKMWAFGILPPIVEGIVIETAYGTLSVNAGSISVEDDGKGSVMVAVYDRGATLENGKQTSFLVSGEKSVLKEGKTFSIQNMPTRVFSDEWVKTNLSQDAVHRSEIAKLQEERRTEVAGILPTSFLYPAKRMAEQVDVLFTLTHDGRTEKRIAQANTRLSEALALVKEGEDTEASAPLAEYKNSLIALAAGEDDNLVQYLIKKQIADASVSLSANDENPDASIQLLTDAVSDVGAAIPDADLKLRDIEGYVLVDRLTMINQILSGNDERATLAASEYADVSPYIAGLLAETDGAHPLLQKEARSLLVTTSELLKNVSKTNTGEVFIAMTSDVEQYLPEKPEEVRVTEEQLNAQVQDMVKRIYIFRQPISRYNQLLAEMRDLETNPNRGTLLRRLKSALPERLGEYVNTEVKKLGDELQGR